MSAQKPPKAANDSIASSLDFGRFNELLLQSTGVGLAAVDAETCEVLFHNQRFEQWFPAVEDANCTLEALLPSFDFEKVAARVAEGRPFTGEIQIKSGRRPLQIAVRIESSIRGDGQVLLVECQNISKVKELEYMIESYSRMVERQNRDLLKEKERVEKLLLNIMPKTIYEEWKQFGITTPQRYEASILMLDFVDFTEMSLSRDPPALISELNDIFTGFDRIVEQFGCERLKTIGDAYIAVCGVPEPTPEHPRNIANVALRMIRYLKRRNEAHRQTWQCRIGINTGPVVGSIVGIQKYVYDIFGPGANLAARLEALSRPMEITLCEDMARHLREEFQFTPRGEVELKGFGRKRIFSLESGPSMSSSPSFV